METKSAKVGEAVERIADYYYIVVIIIVIIITIIIIIIVIIFAIIIVIFIIIIIIFFYYLYYARLKRSLVRLERQQNASQMQWTTYQRWIIHLLSS